MDRKDGRLFPRRVAFDVGWSPESGQVERMFDRITNRHGETLDYTFHEGSEDMRNLLVIGHGVTGNKDRPLVTALAERVSGEGMPCLRFSFSGNGDSQGRFSECTISKEVEDLKSVLTTVVEQGWTPIYAGHSMGAAVGALATAGDGRMRYLISLAGMVETADFCKREFSGVTPDEGFMWDQEECPFSRAFLDDMEKIQTISGEASAVKVPWLFVHGTGDDVVPVQESRSLFALANEPKKLIEIPGADHVFSGEALERVCEEVVSWLGDNLSG